MNQPGRDDWWDDLLFAAEFSSKNLRFATMLRVIAYDISHPKRLRQIAKICESYGARVQLSVFECWLDGERFERMIEELQAAIAAGEDQIVLYSIDIPGAKRRRSLGARATLTGRPTTCLVL